MDHVEAQYLPGADVLSRKAFVLPVLWISSAAEPERGGIFLGDPDQVAAPSSPERGHERMCSSGREQRDVGSIRRPIANDDPSAVIAQGHELYGLDDRSRNVGGRHSRARREVGERMPVDELAE